MATLNAGDAIYRAGVGVGGSWWFLCPRALGVSSGLATSRFRFRPSYSSWVAQIPGTAVFCSDEHRLCHMVKLQTVSFCLLVRRSSNRSQDRLAPSVRLCQRDGVKPFAKQTVTMPGKSSRGLCLPSPLRHWRHRPFARGLNRMLVIWSRTMQVRV